MIRLLLSILSVATPILADALPVFPGAEGFGKYTRGGRGGRVVHVSNLNASGPGSLKAALEAQGPRTVLFDVSGVIATSATIWHPNITVAGQSAPSPGVSIKGSIRIMAGEVLWQHVAVRHAGSGEYDDAFKIVSHADGPVRNVYVDHASFYWGPDETVSILQNGALITDITFDHTIIAEGLAETSWTGKRTGAMGMLFLQGTRGPAQLGRLTLHACLFAHNNQRNPLVKNGSIVTLTNNVVYNWRNNALDMGQGPELPFRIDSINNCYISGPTGGSATQPPVAFRPDGMGTLFVAGNALDGSIPEGQDDLFRNAPPAAIQILQERQHNDVRVLLPTDEVYSHVMSQVGARPAARDDVDARLIQEVASRTGTWRSVNDVAFPELARNVRQPVTVQDPGGDADGDGYTNLEEWLYEQKLAVERGS